MSEIVIRMAKPYPKQREFMEAKSRYVGYGGARGGGKSKAVQMLSERFALKYAGIRILIVRRTYPELLENHIRIMRADMNQVASYKDKDKRLEFINGSSVKFGYCASDGDLSQYQGVEYDVIFIDEATQLTEYQFKVINATCRGINDFPKRTYITCNPGGIGHAWVKRLFIDKEYAEGEGSKEDYSFIRATVRDNTALMADGSYLATLNTLPDELKRAWLDGDWDALAGQYFSEFRREIHTCEPFEIPEWWKRYRAIDYGLDMMACVWAAVDDHGQIYIYQDYQEKDLIVSDAARRILSLDRDDSIVLTFAPPDLKNRQKDTGKSIDDMFRENGVTLTFSDNNRVAGWMRLHELLKPRIAPDGIHQTAKLLIFNTCNTLIRNLPLLMHDHINPNDCSNEPHEITHICDALRYLCMGDFRGSTDTRKKALPQDEFKKKKIRELNRYVKRHRNAYH